MIAGLATLACLAFVAFMFWGEQKQSYRPSAALWIPVAWMFLAGSRWASSWLDLGVPLTSADDYAEGSPVDRAVFLSLIVAGAVVLIRRNLDWGRVLRDNSLIALYLLYALASILWTNEPYVLAKRWIKDLGNPIMALIILTDQRPYQAAIVVLRRLAYLLLPLSLLFVRYFPDLGRVYLRDGSPMYTGVGHQKNDLGLMCLITGIGFAWTLLRGHWYDLRGRWYRIGLLVLFLVLAWLLHMSNSQTSLVCLLAVIGTLLLARLPMVRRRPSTIMPLLSAGLLAGIVLDALLNLRSAGLALLGRNPTLTNRTDLWAVLFDMQPNPLVGSGFMSFWTGERLELIWRKVVVGVNQAHNGYLEQYLNLGYVGVGFILLIALSASYKITQQLKRAPDEALLRLSIVIAALIYNYTEASFYGINNMWLLFLFACMTPPRRSPARRVVSSATDTPRPSPTLAPRSRNSEKHTERPPRRAA
jgi:O-antigen ligase